jgi:hypothetical protein
MRWFGEPWPRADFRAPVCEDDAEQMPVPVGKPCAGCGQPINTESRGVEIPGYLPGRDASGMKILEFNFAYFHARCFLAEVVGDRMALEIVARWEGAPR